MSAPTAKAILMQEVLALRARLDNVKPFSMHMPMVMAAAISPSAMTAIEQHVRDYCLRLRDVIDLFLEWMKGPEGLETSPALVQRRLTGLRLKFTAMLSRFDIFAEAITQRSEHDHGVWLAGLDVLAEDALYFPKMPYRIPPVVCYLDRGIGAAIRRIQTPLPGGLSNPVTIIKVPRERMIGSGIGASIVHETGHQAAAFLDLVATLRNEIGIRRDELSDDSEVVNSLIRWMPEILSDFWSVGKLGISATLGVMTVISLPPVFVKRVIANSSHPTPWVRVKLSAAMGNELYDHPQWAHFGGIWEELYPLVDGASPHNNLLRRYEAALPVLAKIIANHRPPILRGRSLREIMPVADRGPQILKQHFQKWRRDKRSILDDKPTLVMAVMGQAKFDGCLPAYDESRMLNSCLRRWAMRRALDTGTRCVLGIQNAISDKS
jgi:hypothetical protein